MVVDVVHPPQGRRTIWGAATDRGQSGLDDGDEQRPPRVLAHERLQALAREALKR